MELWIGALNLGFLYAFMTMGVFITFRVHNFPDITVDGSFTAGAATAAVLIVSGVDPFLAIPIAFLAGAAAGTLTALIHTRLNINGLLAGILVMTGLYSINLHIMGRSNIPLLNQPSFVAFLEKTNPGFPQEIWIAVCLFIVMGLFWLLVSLFFKTDFGIRMRGTGNNASMASATGVNVNRMKILGVALANGFVGISGCLVAQYQGFADIGMGIGTVVIGLAAVIIGESVLRSRSISVKVLSAIVGSVIFRFMIAFALYVGMNPIDLKLLTAVFVLLTLVVSKVVTRKEKRKTRLPVWITSGRTRKAVVGSVSVVIAVMVIIFGLKVIRPGRSDSAGVHKIGFLQVSDHGLLNITRDSFVEEMERIGYERGKNCIIQLENANGDLPTVNTILDKFVYEDVDVVVPISTACTQATVNRIKDRPVVFATVANPFIIGAGKSETEHLPNVTGVYGAAPMDETMEVVRQILPGKLKVGAIWDPAHANSVFNVGNLQRAVDTYDDVSFVGATITSSSEVYQAAASLVNKGIDAFVLSPDNIVYSAFESIVKAAQPKKIPIFISDVERIEDGAMAAYGYDYTTSGIQAAHLVDRVLKGENPGGIPFERYRKITFGLNLKVAEDIGITIPPDLIDRATKIFGIKGVEKETKPRIGVVQFAMEPNVVLCKEGLVQALAENGYLDKKNIEIIYKNANADFSMINSIIQDFIRRDVDIIVPLSTPCTQSAVRLAGGKKDTAVVFTYIFDPYRIGAARTPTDHMPNITGVACFPPIEEMLDLIQEMFPDRRKVGIVWNSSEANSESVLINVRAHASKIGLDILEATVSSPAEVLEASRSLAIKGAQVFLNSGDNTLNVSFDSFTKVAWENRLPVFSVDSEFVEQGAHVSLGPDYRQTGYEGGVYLARVLNGENPAEIPIGQTEKTNLHINLNNARKLGFKIDEKIIRRADKVINSERKSPELKLNSYSETKGKERLALFYFSDNYPINTCAEGVMDELRQSGLLEKNKIEVKHKNAQNEFYMAQSVAQDIVRLRYDYIITLTTPALQVTANINKTIPHIFGCVTDPYRMGVAKNPGDHLPNITGVASLQPVELTVKTMRELFPSTKRLGLIWNPAEACSETCTIKTRKAAQKYGFDLLEANITGSSEVIEALRVLINKGIDVFFTSGDNSVNAAVESVAEVLKRRKIPYFTNCPADIDRGSFISIGADYYEVGRQTARMVIRVINGEDPRDIPINDYLPEKIYVNLSLARLYGIEVPEEFLRKASEVKR
jgi:putative ABC transport system permease protein